MKANHNYHNGKGLTEEVLSIFQRYKMKANHNLSKSVNLLAKGAFNISKIQDESKSQP